MTAGQQSLSHYLSIPSGRKLEFSLWWLPITARLDGKSLLTQDVAWTTIPRLLNVKDASDEPRFNVVCLLG